MPIRMSLLISYGERQEFLNTIMPNFVLRLNCRFKNPLVIYFTMSGHVAT